MNVLVRMKELYCQYIVKTILYCPDDECLNVVLDQMAQKNRVNITISGDKDIKRVIEYVYLKYLYNNCKIKNNPHLDNNVLIKVALKSIF